MHAHLPRNAPRRAGETEQKSGQNPVHDRALAAIQECAREVIEGALAALRFTAVAFQARLGVVDAPGTAVVALPAGTLEGPIFPPECMEVRLALCETEEVVDI